MSDQPGTVFRVVRTTHIYGAGFGGRLPSTVDNVDKQATAFCCSEFKVESRHRRV